MNNLLHTKGLTRFNLTARVLGILLFLFAGQPLQAQFVEVDKILASDKQASDVFGRSVSISGGRAIVGAPLENTGGSNIGAAYIFERDVSGAWIEVAKVQASDKEAGDCFGNSVSISGDRAIVGAPWEDTGGNFAGAAYIFERGGSGTWIEVAKILASDKEAFDQFGNSVSINGEQVIVGAPYKDTGGTDAGAAYIFERGGSGTWNEVAKVQASDKQASDKFGFSVSISGDRTIVGAVSEDTGETDAGAAYIFERDVSGTWIEVAKVQASDKQAGDELGFSVSISGDRAIAGARLEDIGGTDAGAAYIFERDVSGTWIEVAKVQASDKQAVDRFGTSVSISGDRAIVGAESEDTGGNDAGAAYIFEPSNQPPDVSGAAIADQSAGANCQATISGADVTGVTDPDEDDLTITVNPTTLDLDQNTVTVTADDGNGGVSSIDITVNVVDDTPPVPDVAELPDVTGQCSVTLTAPTATDNCAGTVTGTTSDPLTYTEQGEFTVTWTYDDGNGNTVQQTQKVVVDDVTAPTITLNPDNPMTVVRFNGPYVDPSAVVDDNCDPNPSLTISGSVDTNLPGEYTITYNASDASGNEAEEVTRTVKVVDAPAPVHPYLLLADKKIKIDKQNSAEGDIHANDNIDIHKGPATYKSNLTAVKDIHIHKANTIDCDVTAGKKVKLDKDAIVTGTVTENASVAEESMPELSFSAGGSDVKVDKGQSVTLSPGSYKKIEIKKDSELILCSGDYYADEFNLDKDARLTVDVSTGAVTVNVVKKFEYKKDVVMTLLPFGEVDSRYVIFNIFNHGHGHGHGHLHIEEGARIFGTIVAPEARVHLKKETYFRGSICAKDIDVDKDGVLLHHDAAVEALAKSNNRQPREVEAETAQPLMQEAEVPENFALLQNYPNPFNPTTTITFSIPEATEVHLTMYNSFGQMVRTLVDGQMAAGINSVIWNATNDQGERVASGIYIYLLRAGSVTLHQKVTLLK